MSKEGRDVYTYFEGQWKLNGDEVFEERLDAVIPFVVECEDALNIIFSHSGV
jgi:hypothetical protein